MRRGCFRKAQFLGLLPAVHGDGARACGRMTSQLQFLGLPLTDHGDGARMCGRLTCAVWVGTCKRHPTQEARRGERPDSPPFGAGASTPAAALLLDSETPAQPCTSVLRELAFPDEERKSNEEALPIAVFPRLLDGSQGSLRTSRRLCPYTSWKPAHRSEVGCNRLCRNRSAGTGCWERGSRRHLQRPPW